MLAEFLAIKDALQHCPTCAQKLFDDPENAAIRMCLIHGRVFTIAQVMSGTKSTYQIQVGTNA